MTSLPARAAAFAGVAAFAVLCAASCRDIVGSGDIDAVSELCATLRACYGDDAYDCEALRKAVDEAQDTELVVTFLADFDHQLCLDSCSGSLACLDGPLFCQPTGERCETTGDCCDWSLGLSECEVAEGGGDGTCCNRDGVRCESSDDCCGQNCISGLCGGYLCVPQGESCHGNFECCSKRCDGDECASLVCSELGDPCLQDAECCAPIVAQDEGSDIETPAIECRDQICQVVTDACLTFGSPCDADDPLQTCCEGKCEPATTGQSFCVQGPCTLYAFDCAQDVDCCGPMICRLDFAESVCDDPPNECIKAGECCAGTAQNDGVCLDAQDCCASCCSGACVEGKCLQGTGVQCGPDIGSCHSPTTTGLPIIEDEDICPFADECVLQVKAADPFCACTAWDAICIAAWEECS